MSKLFSKKLVAIAAGIFIAANHAASAQGYPERPVTLVVPFGAGSASDTIARIVAESLSTRLGKRVIIENRAGAGGNTGTHAVAKVEPDGHTLVLAAPGPFVVNKALENLPYDPERDFELISPVATLVNVLVVNPTKVPVSNIKEFVDFVKARPGEVSYASVGLGSSQHLAAAYFDIVAGTKMVHVPYRSGSQIAVDLVTGNVPVSFQLIPNVAGQLAEGQLKPLAVTTKMRSKSLPDVPTMAEQGISNYECYAWFGIAAPKGTPREIVERLNRDIAATMANPAVQKRLIEIGVEPWSADATEFKEFVSAEIVKWTDIIKTAGIRAN